MTVSTPQGVDPPIGIASMEVLHSLPSPTASSQSEVHSNSNDEAELLSVSWNQDYGCFVAATSYSFHIYNCEPFGEILRRIFENGGFRIVELLFRCNYFALVGDGANPQFPPNSVMIWDDRRGCCKGELRFKSNVRAVKLRDGYVVVVLEHSILVYRFIDLKLIRIFETSTNPRGLCCLSHYSTRFLLACPGLQEGQVRVEHFDLKTLTLINAHDSHIACLSLTLDGLLLATASTKGTLIRIFNTKDGNCIQEVRRGRDRADIYNIAFSPNMQWLAVSSDKGTVHVFSLRVQGVSEDASRQHASGISPGMVHQNSLTSQAALTSPNTGVNRCSSLSYMKGVLPKYFSSEWSFAKFHLPEATRHIAAFGAQSTIVIVSMDGSFYRCSFDPLNGGEMVQQECIRFLKSQQQP